VEAALAETVAAGARAATELRTEVWGKILVLADPFGHGLCLSEFVGRGYDEITESIGPGLRRHTLSAITRG